MELGKCRTCAKCGQVIDMIRDSYNYPGGGGPAHVTCPPSLTLQSLPIAPAEAAQASGASPSNLVREYYTVAEAADLLRTHPQTIRRYIRGGKLSAKRLPGGIKASVLIARADLLGLLEDAREAA